MVSLAFYHVLFRTHQQIDEIKRNGEWEMGNEGSWAVLNGNIIKLTDACLGL